MVMQRNSAYPRPTKLPVRPPAHRPQRQHALPRNMAGSILNLSGLMVYLWLQNGQSFWFLIANTQKDKIMGYAWMGQGWQRREIYLKLIWSYY